MSSKSVKIPDTDEAWESGELGRSDEHTKEAPAELVQGLDEALELQMISIRLPKEMIEGFKFIAGREGMKYQTLMKQALQRFAVCEMKRIAGEMESQMKQQEARAQAELNAPKRNCA